MNRLHIGVAALNLCALAAMLSAFLIDSEYARERLVTFAVLGGYLGNFVAVLVFLAVSVAMLLWAANGRGRIVLRDHWLALANGALVLLAWGIYFAVGNLRS
jgi:hypothetical protein